MPDLKDLWRLVQAMNDLKAWRFRVWRQSSLHAGENRHDNAELSDEACPAMCQITRKHPLKPVR